MSTLSDLKTTAAAKLANVPADVTTYITALEAKASANKYWIGGGAVAGAIVGWLAKALFK